MEPYIYTIVEKEKLNDALESLHNCIGLSIQVLDESGNVLKQFGNRKQYCVHFTSHLSSKNTCAEIHTKAGKRAMELGESYIFSCHSNLNHIVFPLISKNQLLGSILIGPFLMSEPDSTLVLDVGKHYPDLTMEDLMDLYDDSFDVPIVSPPQVTNISKLLFYLMSNLVSDSKEQFIINQKKLHQQARISESIQMYKNQMPSNLPKYPFEKEQALLAKVKEGNLEESSKILNDLLGFVFLSEGSSTEVVKYRSLELCSLLSRAAIENGATSEQVFELSNNFIARLPNFTSVDDICYALIDILSAFMECMFPKSLEQNKTIRAAIAYISNHFAEDISLDDIAGYLHLNPSYFSRVFKTSFGSTFKEYLTSVRIEEAKRLLKNTDYSLIDIAIAVGFDNQSYFNRVFKKSTGVTPKQYRK